MNKSYLILVFFFLSYNYENFPQDNINNFNGSVKINYAKINFDGMVTMYETGNTKVYPSIQVPVQKRHYTCTFSIMLSGDDFILQGPLYIKCLLSNGETIWWTLNPEVGYFNSKDDYDFTFELYRKESLFGQANLELMVSGLNTMNSKNDDEFVFDKTTIFIQ